MKKLFNLTALGGTFTVLLFMVGFANLGIQVEFLNVIEQAFEDFDLTHIYYSKLRDSNDVPVEDEIVLVNIGKLGRGDIAKQINILNQYEPKVIGIDARFFGERNMMQDFQLQQAFKNTKNIVIGSELVVNSDTSTTWDDLLLPYEMFQEHVTTGFVNIGNEEGGDFPFWGDFVPRETMRNGDTLYNFDVVLMSLYDKDKAERFKNRNKERETIYFKGNLDKYAKLDIQDVMNENFVPEMIKDKIVLMGYMGDEGYDKYFFDEDRFYTPLNENLMGRSTPDMFGVVVHANILSMMLDEKYINVLPQIYAYLIAILFCYLNVALFVQIIENPKLGVWYNAISKVIQLIEAIIVYSVNLFLFDWFNYQVDLSITLFVIILSGDIAEIYVDVILNMLKRFVLKLNI